MKEKRDLKMMEDEIEKLVLKVQQGDQQAFGELYDIFIDSIYRYIFFRVKDEDAEDLVENLFIKVWQHIKSYKKGKSSFTAWIFRITHNLVVDYYRTSKEKDLDILDISLPDTKREHNPIRVTENIFDQKILRRALAKLKKNYREIIIYKFINDLSNEEISAIMGKSEGNLRILQHRALKALKNELELMGIHYDM